MSDAITPKLGEVWEDAEGTLYCVVREAVPDLYGTGVFTFGTAVLLDLEDNVAIIPPYRRVFLNDGTLDVEFLMDNPILRYPNGTNVVRREN